MDPNNFNLRRLIVAALLIFNTFLFASAQADTATLTGQVTDPNGAAVAGANVTTINQATNISLSTTSNDAGYYTFASLRPGLYTIEVTQTGFDKSVRKEFEVNVGRSFRLDFPLQVGVATEIVEVTGETQSALQRDEATIGNVVDNRRVSTLPLPQRSWDDLLTQVAGTQGDPYTEQSGGTAAGRTGSVNIHGVRSLQNNFILDGQDNNSISTNVQEFSTQVSRPSIDSLSEFRVITSPFSAEYGRAAGGVVTVTTKSGGNDFHGLLYEYHRNRIFDSNDFFSNRLGRDRPQRVQNQFGGNVGGPIWKNKAFFFADYEGTRIRQGVLRIANVPLTQFRAGNFSSLLGANQFEIFAPNGMGGCSGTGQFVRTGQIFNPTTTRPNPCLGLTGGTTYGNLPFIRDPFAGNIIPTVDPVSARLIALYPNPTGGGTPNAAGVVGNNFARTPTLSDDADRFTTRLDFRINEKSDIFGRYAWGKRDRFVPGFFGGLADGTDTSAWGLTAVNTHALSLGWNYVISSNVVNQFRFGFNYADALSTQEPFLDGNSSTYIPGLPDVNEGGIPSIIISGFSPRLGSPDFLPKFQTSKQFQFTNTTSWIKGSHTIKFGPDVMAPLILDYIDVPGTRGRFDFAANYTGLPNAAATGLIGGTGNALADFLVGRPTNVLLTNAKVVEQRRHMYAFFIQDDWKVTQRLSLNLGLRYDFGSPSYENNNQQANFDPVAGAAATTQAQALASLRLATDGSLEDRTLVKPDRNNFAPRVGFAYGVTDKLVVRGGYGIFYNLIDRIGSEDQIALNPPFVINFNTRTDAPGSSVANTTLSGGIPPNLLNPSNISVRNVQLRAANPDSETPYIQQGGIGVQFEFGNGWFSEANYVHTRGTKLYTLRNLNQSLPGRQTTRPFSQFGLIEYRDDNGISRYNALETTLDRRFGNGWTLRAVYTLSDSKDNSGEHLTSGGSSSFPDNSRDLTNWYGPSDFDVRHRFVVNGIWELPFGKGRQFFSEGIASAILGGWELAGSMNLRSGRPFTVSQSGDPLQIGGLATTLADLVGDPERSDRSSDGWFNTAAFRALPTGSQRFGEQPRNSLRGPAFSSVDLAVHRKFPLWSEATNLELRWEIFNALNVANFGLPNRTVNGGGFGTITTLQGDPRIMQFALRFSF